MAHPHFCVKALTYVKKVRSWRDIATGFPFWPFAITRSESHKVRESRRILGLTQKALRLPEALGLFTTFHVDTPDGEQFLQRLAGRFLCFAPKIVEHSRYLLRVSSFGHQVAYCSV